MFGGGGRNFWELKGGNAQEGGLQTFYAGVRPGSRENSAYYPMHKKGAIQMGNGGDNGNGSGELPEGYESVIGERGAEERKCAAHRSPLTAHES